MKTPVQSAGVLDGCRALDLTDEKGFLCGKILADLSVDVIKVEPPGGDPSRRMGPFWHDIPDPEKSLYWFAYNSNKRGITLDIKTSDGKEIFKKLAERCDFVIESFKPGYMDELGLGYAALSGINKGIILTSITAFGQTGPYRDFEGSDIVVMGMSGSLYLTGDSDRRPLNISIPQACLHAGADAGVGSMIAYYNRKRTGEGQHVDVSMQQSAAWFLASTVPWYELSALILSRVGTFKTTSYGKVVQRQVWPCKDGYVFFFMLGGPQGAKTCRALVKWMDDLGMANDFLRTFIWEEFDMFLAEQDLVDRISGPIEEFFRTRTKKEVLDATVARSISISPLFSMEDELNDQNLAARGFWTQVDHPELNAAIPYPRQLVRFSETQAPTTFRAPLIGEHNREVYGELGLSVREIVALKEAGII
jgi:crotonobetainyl-CoA:carnitine CoA-transferase CaiB-like acyl-CoA transferase